MSIVVTNGLHFVHGVHFCTLLAGFSSRLRVDPLLYQPPLVVAVYYRWLSVNDVTHSRVMHGTFI